MSTLEKVMQLKQQGVSEYDIIQSLRQEGISPREIDDALSQVNIKSELSNSNEEYMGDMPMQPSIMEQEQPPVPGQQNYQEPYPQEEYMQYDPNAQESYPEQYQQQYYQEYQPQQQLDIETINDIAEQIAEEKSEKLKSQIASISRVKEDLTAEVKRIEARLTKIESIIDNLQIAVLKKIGNYGEEIHNISKEMRATQESFSKLINPITDNARGKSRTAHSAQEEQSQQSRSQQESRKRSKSKPDFEDYLR